MTEINLASQKQSVHIIGKYSETFFFSPPMWIWMENIRKKNAEWGRWIQAIHAKHFCNIIYDFLEAIVVIFVVRLCSIRQFHLTLYLLSETNTEEKRTISWYERDSESFICFWNKRKEGLQCARLHYDSLFLFFFPFFVHSFRSNCRIPRLRFS